jgi:hypothetical protein
VRVDVIIGFTGTRHGMTEAQKRAVGAFLASSFELDSFLMGRHGDCVGADAEFHDMVKALGDPACVTIHPPVDEALRAFKAGDFKGNDTLLPPKTHFARNRDIVDKSDFLLATPRDSSEQQFGGTWYTVNYARKKGKPVVIFWPDGSLEKSP